MHELYYKEHADEEDEDVDFDNLSEQYDSDEVTTEEEEQGDEMELGAEPEPARPLLQRRNAIVPGLSFFGTSGRRHGDGAGEDLDRSHGEGPAPQ